MAAGYFSLVAFADTGSGQILSGTINKVSAMNFRLKAGVIDVTIDEPIPRTISVQFSNLSAVVFNIGRSQITIVK